MSQVSLSHQGLNNAAVMELNDSNRLVQALRAENDLLVTKLQAQDS